MESYVFFIGGTGMRVMRSFLHLCASGAVGLEEAVNVVMLDVDSENDACTEARELYDIYNDTYRRLHEPQVLEALNGNGFAPFSTRLKLPNTGAAVINPITDSSTTLEMAASGASRVLGWFYTRNERTQPLKHGFFAHPNVGCLFFDGVRSAVAPYIGEMVNGLNNDKDVRIVIVGSMFGGTGAAGIPIVLRMISESCAQHVSSADKLQRLHFGGVLVTPYFKFSDPAAEQDGKVGGNLRIQHNLFYGNTRSALEYYSWNFKSKFDRLYLAGQDKLQIVTRNGRYCDGGSDQTNKPHIVELIAAMGVRQFLTNTDGTDKMNIYEMILRSPLDENEPVFGWNSLETELSAVADMLRTQALMRTVVVPSVRGQFDGRWPWMSSFHMENTRNQAEVDAWLQYTDLFLDWMYNMQYKLNESGDDGWEKDPRISLAGTPLEAIVSGNGMKTSSILKNFKLLIENRTEATNVFYSHTDGRIIMADLGARGKYDPKKQFTSLGMTGLFTQLYDLASKKV